MIQKVWIALVIPSLVVQAGSVVDANISIVHQSSKQMEIAIDYDSACEVAVDRKSGRVGLKIHCPHKHQATKQHGTKPPMQNQIVKTAIMKLGAPYKYAHAGPESFDCSGFVYYVYGKNGIAIPRTSKAQSQMPTKLTRSEIQKGDILFFDTANRGHVNHSGIYIGKGKFIHASSGKAHSVVVSELDKGFYKDKFRWGTRVGK